MVEPLRALAIVPLFYHIATILLAATQSLGVMRWAFWARSIAQPLVLFAATSVALRSGAGSGGAALAVAGGMGATAVLAALAYARELPLGATLRAAFVSPLDRTTLRLASPLLAANLLWALLSRLDAFVLGHYVSIEQLGAYSACGLYAASISQLRGAFDPVTSSLVAPALARGDVAGLAAAIERQTHWLALAAFPLLGTFVGFGGPLLRVFGRDFDGGVVALGVLAVGHTANALALASFTLPLSGHGRYTTIVAACALVVQGAACAILVPRFGIVGGACALALGFVGAQTAQLVIAKRVVGVLGLSPRLLVTLACTAVAIVAARGVFAVVTGGLAVRCIVALGAAAVIYIVLVWKLVLRRAEL